MYIYHIFVSIELKRFSKNYAGKYCSFTHLYLSMMEIRKSIVDKNEWPPNDFFLFRSGLEAYVINRVLLYSVQSVKCILQYKNGYFLLHRI